MKVLHLCTTDAKGAGLCAYRIHKQLLDHNIESKMLVLEKHHIDKDVIQVFKYRFFFFRVYHFFLRLLHIYMNEYDILIRQTGNRNTLYSRPFLPFDISNNKYVKEADIIHLHWTDNFFDLPNFLKKINKPIIWTLHDEGLFCGTAHYEIDTIQNDILDLKYREIRKNMIRNRKKTGIVLLSQYFYETYKEHCAIKGCHIRVINNSVDCSKFQQKDRNISRKRLGISDCKIVFLFIAAKINDPRKGLDILIRAVERLNNPDMVILAIGDDKTFQGHKIVKSIGCIYDHDDLSYAISAADYFVMPSKQEAFAQTPIEAMACGIPSILFPVSGTHELINAQNGVLCDECTVDSLVKGINKAMKFKYCKDEIIEFAKRNYSPSIIINEYIKYYNFLIHSFEEDNKN